MAESTQDVLTPIIEQCEVTDRWMAYFQAVFAEGRARYAGYGATYPESIEEWMTLARRVGMSADRVLEGHWTARKIDALAKGYFESLADSRKMADAKKDNGDAPDDPRGEWIYSECCKGTQYASIGRKLAKKPKGWERIESPQGIRSAAIRYAEQRGLPLPQKRQHGRPKN